MTEGKKVRLQIKTMNNLYEGDMLIPPMRNRIVDVVNEEQRLFINLTDVVINNQEHAEFVSLNKNLITAIIQLDSGASKKSSPRSSR
jgi:hypothetical protein